MSTKILALSKAAPLPAKPKRPYLPNGTKHISPSQADSFMDAARFAEEQGKLLNAHCTIHWQLTDAGSDTDGKRLAKVREGLSKVLARHGIQFTANWSREAPHGNEHAHIVFHLPHKYWTGAKKAQADKWVQRAIERLVERHGGDIADFAVRITRVNGWPTYLIKGGTPEVWRKYRLLRKWRKSQGIIFGKRCGSTQNIGPQARERWWGNSPQRQRA